MLFSTCFPILLSFTPHLFTSPICSSTKYLCAMSFHRCRDVVETLMEIIINTKDFVKSPHFKWRHLTSPKAIEIALGICVCIQPLFDAKTGRVKTKYVPRENVGLALKGLHVIQWEPIILWPIFSKALMFNPMQIRCEDMLRPRQNGHCFADDTFKCIFLNDDVRILINISLKFDNRTWLYLVIYKSGCDSELLDEFITCHKPQDMPLHSVHSDGTNKLSQQNIGTSALRSINYSEKCESAAGAIPRREIFVTKNVHHLDH